MANQPRPYGLGWQNRPFGPDVRAARATGAHTGKPVLNGPFRAGDFIVAI
jgi:hypothetical protein